MIIEMIEKKSKDKCNRCRRSFAEMVELFYMKVTQELKQDNAPVSGRFEEVIESCVQGSFEKKDVENARKMLNCNVHRAAFCVKNLTYFEEKILSVKD